MKTSVLAEKTYAFALRIVKLHKHLRQQKTVERALLLQLLRCGTSVGANVEEAGYAQSRADFVSKLSIARKEARETDYWLRLLHDAEYLDPAGFASLRQDLDEILRLLTSSIKTSQRTRTPETSATSFHPNN